MHIDPSCTNPVISTDEQHLAKPASLEGDGRPITATGERHLAKAPSLEGDGVQLISTSSSSSSSSSSSNGSRSGSDSESASLSALVGQDHDQDDAFEGVSVFADLTAAVGFGAQYFAVGILYAGLPATLYGVFLGYLNVPAYVYSTAKTLCTLPWSFKLIFGALNDTTPILGKHRLSYMIIGWSLSALALAKLSVTPLPPPYWCVDDMGNYVMKETLPDGRQQDAKPCNPEAAKESGQFTFLLMMAAFGYIVADVAADGLMVQYAKLEPVKERGRTQSTAYSVRSIGSTLSYGFVGFCMNGKQYNGSFSWSLSFNSVMACFAAVAMAMVPISFFLLREPPSKSTGTSLKEYLNMCWEALCGRGCFFAVMFLVLFSSIGGVDTTAGPLVKEHWAGVQNLQNQIFSMIGNIFFACGLGIVTKYFLSTSWHLLIVVCVVFITLVDSIFTSCTIFGIVRNQYFYLGESVLLELPMASLFLVSVWLCTEISDEGNEGMMYGLLTTSMNLGYTLASAISNQLFRCFRPALSDDDNYIHDDPSFRSTVFASVVLAYGCSFLSLLTLWLLPRQKAEALERKRTWPRHVGYGVFTVLFVSCALVYSLSVDILSMFPSTMCLEYAGGDGCDSPDSANMLNTTA